MNPTPTISVPIDITPLEPVDDLVEPRERRVAFAPVRAIHVLDRAA